MQDVRAIRDGESLAHVVIGDQHSDTSFLEAAHDFLDVPDGDGVDAREGLVQEEIARVGHQRARDFEPPPLAARQGVGPMASEPGEIQFGEQLLEPGPPLLLRQVEGLQDGQEILLDRELSEHR